jgi:hypothetical protein
MTKFLFSLVTLYCFIVTLQAQNERKCAADEYLQSKLSEDPTLENSMQQIEQFTQRYLDNKSLQRESGSGIITIPVVVHVLWRTDAENISDEQIQSQIDVLNEDFRKLNADFNQTHPDFIERGADYEIEFCLASKDPNGNPTNGIERKQTIKVSWSTNDAMKKAGSGGLNAWNADKYLNIWVCNLGGGILGYATFPGGNKALDGVVILTTAFGRVGNVKAPFDQGATTTHEVGHWLNLRHIWGDAQPTCGNDFVEDTPRANGPNYNCNLNKTSCNNRNMVQNYMDYTDDACMTLFTVGQKARSMALFAPGGFRYALLSSDACGEVVPTCGVASPSVSNIGNTSAGLSFPAVQNATNYLVEISSNGTTWTTAGSGTNTAYNLSNLSECSNYQVKVTTTCTEIGTSVSDLVSFSTSGAACACGVPQNVSVSNITLKQATARWGAVSSATIYEVRRKQVTQTTWKVWTNITKLQYVMPGHLSNKNYEAQVRAFCPITGWSAWSPSVFYTSATYRTDGSENSRLADDMLAPSFNIYPNPANNSVSLEYFGQDVRSAEIRVYDITGRVAKIYMTGLSENSNTQLDLSGLPNGVYFIHTIADGKAMNAQKLMIAR